MRIGDPCTYVDPTGVERPGLITAIHNVSVENPLVNLVVVSIDETKSDSYGRQIERFTSVSHESHPHAHGNYYK